MTRNSDAAGGVTMSSSPTITSVGAVSFANVERKSVVTIACNACLYGATRNAESEAVRLKAIDRILDRALGKAPQHADVSALRHTEIVYRSAEEIRKALIEAGAPPVLLDLTDDEEDDDAADNADHA